MTTTTSHVEIKYEIDASALFTIIIIIGYLILNPLSSSSSSSSSSQQQEKNQNNNERNESNINKNIAIQKCVSSLSPMLRYALIILLFAINMFKFGIGMHKDMLPEIKGEEMA